MDPTSTLESRSINTLRFLSADAVQRANSGHPGLPMGAAAIAHTLWTRHLRFNPKNPQWVARDRFILSGGHGSMLLYSLLYLSGYDLSMDQIMNFRQWGSITPGHPEYGLTPGVEATTGPLGQGFATGVGMAAAADYLSANFDRPGYTLFPQFIYGIVTDGDLMEGVTSEAASLAGHLQLGRLIYLYDDNGISIDGSTDLAFTEDRKARFLSYHWHVEEVGDGNDVQAIDLAIQKAKLDPRPSLIAIRTIIGFGLPNKQGTAKAHGEPPGENELQSAKENLGWPLEPAFYVPTPVLDYYRSIGEAGARMEQEWQSKFERYCQEYPDDGAVVKRILNSELPAEWEMKLPFFTADDKGMATRAASGKVINALAASFPELIGGSADLAPSNVTWIKDSPSFQKDCREGRNFHFGVREHAMGAMINGMALHGGVIPYGGTFLVFSDYLRPALRLSALSEYASIWIFTHDSIGLGEDGPTHQPVEQLASLRAIPNLVVIRPADANEVTEAWKVAVERRHGPTAIVLSRQNLPTLDRDIYTEAGELAKGAYVLCDLGGGNPEIILIASGSEVNLIIQAGNKLQEDGIKVRLISMPSWELFKKQTLDYRDQVLPPGIQKRLAVEAGISQGWHEWIGVQGDLICLDRFGASAPYQTLFSQFGFTPENVYQRAIHLLNR